MSLLSPRLQLKVQQKQILTPGLVQMVTVLQLNRLELRDMITAEISENPVLDAEQTEELTPAEVQALLEAERERDPHPADEAVLQATRETAEPSGEDIPEIGPADIPDEGARVLTSAEPDAPAPAAENTETDPFDQIDFGSYFDDFLDPGFRSPASEDVEKPSFETFLSSPVLLPDYLRQQLSLVVMSEAARDAADSIIGNLDENGYLTMSLEEIATSDNYKLADLEEALTAVHGLDPAGVGARNLQECLLLQIESRGGRGGVAWLIVQNHLKLVEMRNIKELARVLGRPMEHVQTALAVIRTLDPKPGLRYSGPGARQVEPDVTIFKDGEDYIIQLNDDDLPQLRLNGQYRRMLDRENEPSKDVRNYIKERYASALQLIRNIEQRKQTILRVCETIVKRQREFLDNGIENLRPMMIKEVAEEIGVHPSTVSRAVASKFAHTPQGVYELRFFFSEAVQGPSGGDMPLLLLKRKVKEMIEKEDQAHPLTDDQITARLNSDGITVTRRTVAKYREDMKIPSTHHRRVRN